MSRSERDKGARGEREVVKLLAEYGLPVVRTPNSGGLHVRGDLTGVPGYHFEVKRQETLRIPEWLRQAHEDAAPTDVPVVVFRQSKTRYDNLHDQLREPGVMGEWHGVLPLSDLAALLDLARLTTRESGR